LASLNSFTEKNNRIKMKHSKKNNPLLRGKYLVRNPLACLILWSRDLLYNLVYRRANTNVNPEPQKILLSSVAHLGDVIMSSSILPYIHALFPECEIGVLMGSWSKNVLHDHPLIKNFHYFDHWKLNRSNLSFLQKLRISKTSSKKAIEEIKAVNYDIAIDLYAYFPNAIPLIHRTGIPTRIGYTSGGNGPLLTHTLDWHHINQSEVHYQAALLRQFDPKGKYSHNLHTNLPPITKHCFESLQNILPKDQDYILIHVGTGNRLREWPVEHWTALAHLLCENTKLSLVFTGIGNREEELIGKITQAIPSERTINLCSSISWEQFVAVIKKAELVLGVESVAGHVAAAVDTPSVIIGSGITNHHQWRPFSKLCRYILADNIDCMPCYRSKGCPTMDCLRNISPQIVYAEVINSLSKIPVAE